MTRRERRHARTRRQRIARTLGALALVLAACAPLSSHIYSVAEGGDNTVTAASGPQAVGQTWAPNVTHVTTDYRGASWTDTRIGGANGSSLTAFRVQGSGSMNGMYGGTITYADNSTLWDDWHYRNGLKVEQPRFVADRITVVNEGDGVKNGGSGSDFRLAHSWVNGSQSESFSRAAS